MRTREGGLDSTQLTECIFEVVLALGLRVSVVDDLPNRVEVFRGVLVLRAQLLVVLVPLAVGVVRVLEAVVEPDDDLVLLVSVQFL